MCLRVRNAAAATPRTHHENAAEPIGSGAPLRGINSNFESPMNTKIYIVTVDGFFGQSIPTEKSLDTSLLQREFSTFGHDTALIDIEDVANGDLDKDAIYLFGSHQNADIKHYIDDIVAIRFLHQPYKCIPPPQCILAHENKGIQSMLAREVGLDLGDQTYHYRSEEPLTQNKVAKLVDGAGSNGVFLATAGESLYRKLMSVGKSSIRIFDITFQIKCAIKKVIRHKTLTSQFYAYNKKYWRHVRQNLFGMPGFDFKVLVFYDRIFVLRRGARPNDFRSSGSGLFDFVPPPAGLLDSAMRIRKQLNSPYISLDLIPTENGFRCIEFQCTHFGPYTQMYANKLYTAVDGEFVEQENFGTTESHIARSVSAHLLQTHNS